MEEEQDIDTDVYSSYNHADMVVITVDQSIIMETFNAGNFQEYDYESEWIECSWKIVYGQTHLVSSYEKSQSEK